MCKGSVVRMTEETLFEFPCAFPIKIMGAHRGDFEQEILKALDAHVGPIEPHQVQTRLSRNGQYISLTLTFEAQSKSQIDDVYRCLTAHPWVKLVF
jgi:putative lipoic acid-binding regulatory protein